MSSSEVNHKSLEYLISSLSEFLFKQCKYHLMISTLTKVTAEKAGCLQMTASWRSWESFTGSGVRVVPVPPTPACTDVYRKAATTVAFLISECINEHTKLDISAIEILFLIDLRKYSRIWDSGCVTLMSYKPQSLEFKHSVTWSSHSTYYL